MMSSITQFTERMKARLRGGPDLKVMRDKKDDESFSLQPCPIITE